MTSNTAEANILIVDDEPENLNVLGELLTSVGYRVSAFPRGDLALAAVRDELPDLVLLDIRMPGMDGYEVCRHFKAVERLQQIPIIFLSAFAELSDKVRAFQSGGVDYILKPFAEAEVLARVNTHLGLRRHQLHLEKLVQQRVRELTEAHRRLQIWDDAKNQWLNVLSHEMRTPLTGLIGISELLFMDLPPDSEHHSLRTDYNCASRRISKLIDDALTLTRIDVESKSFAVTNLPLAQVMRNALAELAGQSPECEVHATLDALEDVTVVGELELLHRALNDLLLTATHCVGAGERITVETRIDSGQAELTILTHGKSLPGEALETFFDVGGQRILLKGGGDFGLGAALSSRIIQLFNGRISVRNGTPSGLVMEISLPVN